VTEQQYDRHTFGMMDRNDMLYYLYRGLLSSFPEMRTRDDVREARVALTEFAEYHQKLGKSSA
jgi:hypothetical protein